MGRRAVTRRVCECDVYVHLHHLGRVRWVQRAPSPVTGHPLICWLRKRLNGADRCSESLAVCESAPKSAFRLWFLQPIDASSKMPSAAGFRSAPIGTQTKGQIFYLSQLLMMLSHGVPLRRRFTPDFCNRKPRFRPMGRVWSEIRDFRTDMLYLGGGRMAAKGQEERISDIRFLATMGRNSVCQLRSDYRKIPDGPLFIPIKSDYRLP